MTNRYSVTAVIQSEGNEPVGMNWATNADELEVMESVVQLFKNNRPQNVLFPPPHTLSIHIQLTDLDK